MQSSFADYSLSVTMNFTRINKSRNERTIDDAESSVTYKLLINRFRVRSKLKTLRSFKNLKKNYWIRIIFTIARDEFTFEIVISMKR